MFHGCVCNVLFEIKVYLILLLPVIYIQDIVHKNAFMAESYPLMVCLTKFTLNILCYSESSHTQKKFRSLATPTGGTEEI